MFSKKSRIGKFKATREVVGNHQAMMAIQEGMYIVAVDYDGWRDGFEFTGVCDDFIEVDEACVVPRYEMELIEIKDANTIEFRRRIKFIGYGD